jgi:hypothetical protein
MVCMRNMLPLVGTGIEMTPAARSLGCFQKQSIPDVVAS